MDKDYDFETAWALVQRKDYEEARNYALPYANAGDSNAQCLIGFLCEFGWGMPLDLDEAEGWLRKAAEQNNPVAWNNLGTLLLKKGEGENAKKSYQRAVELGFAMAAPLAK